MPITIVKGKKLNAPDPAMVKDQLAGLQNMYKVYGVHYLARNLLWILRKNPEKGVKDRASSNQHWNKRLVPFRFTRIQRDITNRARDRNICLKPRQAGYTTYFICIRLYLLTIIDPGSGGLLISQNNKYAAKHFDILKRAHRYVGSVDPMDSAKNLLHRQLLANLLHTTYSSRRELVFDQLDSMILCDSAEVTEVGQGLTLTRVVATEVARWDHDPEETLANLKEAIPAGGTLDLESTASGMGGYFFDECMRARDTRFGEPEFNYFFHPWYWHEEYRDELELEEELTEEEQRTMEHCKLDLYQMAWRRKKMVSLRHEFPEKYPEDDMTCFLTSGNSFFDREICAARLMELKSYKPTFIGRDANVQIFKKALKRRQYIIGADPATGRQVSSENVDFSAAKVIDKDTGEEMASYRARVTPDDFGSDLAELGRAYNNAEIAVERTGDGGTVMLQLQGNERYGNVYKHKEWWRRQRDKVVEVEGFPTSVKTRPIALNALLQFVKNNPEWIWDKTLVEEMLTFVRNEKGKPEASKGAHDDTVLAAAIAHCVRLIRCGYLDPLTWKKMDYGTDLESDSTEGDTDADVD